MVRRCRPLLGTFVSIEADIGTRAIENAFAIVEHVHARMSFHADDSDLARLRTAPWRASVAVSRETVTVLRCAAMLHAETDGLFDVTVARRLIAAGFLPRPGGVDLRRMIGGAEDIEIVGDTQVRCHRPMAIDLGGIAKGFAVDLAVSSLIADGATQGIVDAGGDLRVFGAASRPIGIRDGEGRVRYAIYAQDIAIATSSNLQSRRRHRGREFSPHFGAGQSRVLTPESVSIGARECMIADAFTKIALADRAVAVRLLARHAGSLIELPPAALAA